MATTTWHYASNQFEVATIGNFKKMNILISDHLAKLNAEKADAAILYLYNRTLPVKTEWDNRYSNWLSADGIYRGETKRFENMLAELRSTKIAEWDAKVQVVFLEKTPDYIAIFPDGRNPFQIGTYDGRIEEVEALGKRLANYPALAALKTEVDAYAVSMHQARDLQQAKEDLLSKASDLLEQQRIVAARMLYANIGRLIDKFVATPTQMERFYDLSVLRETSDFPRNGSVADHATENIIERAFQSGTQLLLKNTGSTPLMFCLSATKDGACTAGVIIPPNSEEVHSINDLGDTANTFLNVTNLGAVQGSWLVDEV